MDTLKTKIEAAWENRELLKEAETQQAIREVIDLTVQLGRLTSPGIRPVGIAVNTQALGEDEARALLDALATEHGLPATDPVRFGVDALVDRIVADFPEA